MNKTKRRKTKEKYHILIRSLVIFLLVMSAMFLGFIVAMATENPLLAGIASAFTAYFLFRTIL